MTEPTRPSNFLAEIVAADLAAGRNGAQVVTQFPPEPNGFLHIGHAKSILLNFGLAKQFGGRTHLRFDDTNPVTEDTTYVEAIQNDVRWLGAEWGTHLYYASDFFERMYECAVRLVRDGKAYVDSQPVEAVREQRGSFERPGTDSPFRDRPVAENLDLFTRMRAGEFPDGACVLRAKIDMAHPNLLMRDPLLYRIRHAHHHRTGDAWCIYPMYDYAHPLEDAFEGVTHSICTLEFESNRELYDWTLDNLGPWNPRPHQYEFARLGLGYTVMSKRKLLQLVTEKYVSGWDDPRMPTLAGMRRRGVTPQALHAFADLIGVAKNNSLVDIGKLEFCIRQDLETQTPRAFAVLNPLKVTLTNWPAERIEALAVPWWPEDPTRGQRQVAFGRDLLIEREDFSETPPNDWKRLAPGRSVRLARAYVVTCDEVVRDAAGAVTELRCSVDLQSLGADRKTAGTLHWVHATCSIPLGVRLYDRLFKVEQPDAEGDFLPHLNPESLVTAPHARGEGALAAAAPGTRWQFLRMGYFFADPIDSKPGAPVFNRIITLRDTWTQAPATVESRRPERKREDSNAKKRDEKAPAAGAAQKKSRAELRADLRAATPALAERFARYRAELKLSDDDADTLTGDLTLATYFDGALTAHPNAPSVARWLVNDLLGLAKDRDLSALPLPAAGFGRFVALVDAGRVTAAAGKTLLARLVAEGGDPEQRLAELGLQKVDDGAAVTAAVGRVLERHAAEVQRYRAGEKKLFGVLLGAAMRELQGAGDPTRVRSTLTEALG